MTGSLSQKLFCQLQAKGKWHVILESLKKKKRPTNTTINQTNKCTLTNIKGYIYVVSIWDSCLKLLQVILVFHLYLYRFWWGSCHGVTWSLSLPLPLSLCLHIQFLEDMCKSFVWCACMFNSWRICAQFLYYVPTCSILEGYMHNFCIPTLLD